MDLTRGAVNLGRGVGGLEVHGIGSHSFFLLRGHSRLPSGENVVGISFQVKINKYNVKSLIYNAYTITRKFCVLRKKSNISGAKGDREGNC